MSCFHECIVHDRKKNLMDLARIIHKIRFADRGRAGSVTVPRFVCLRYPSRHVYAADRRVLLTYLLTYGAGGAPAAAPHSGSTAARYLCIMALASALGQTQKRTGARQTMTNMPFVALSGKWRSALRGERRLPIGLALDARPGPALLRACVPPLPLLSMALTRKGSESARRRLR